MFEKPSFRNAWKKRQFCGVPTDAFYEPNYETGKAVRWPIERVDDQPLLSVESGTFGRIPMANGFGRFLC